MKLSADQEKRLARFRQYLQAKFPGDGARQAAHDRVAQKFEIFLLGRDLPFARSSFRTYLLELHRAARRPQEEREAEQAHLRQYYHALRSEIEKEPQPGGPEASPETSPAPAPPRPPQSPAVGPDVAEASSKAAAPASPGPAEPTPSAPAEGSAEPSPFGTLPGEEEMVCPACGAQQPRAEECAHCGIVFEKWRRRAEQTAQARAGLEELRRKVDQQIGSRRNRRTDSSGLNQVLFFLLAPILAIIFLGTVVSAHKQLRAERVEAEQELLTLNQEIEDLATPPAQRVQCVRITRSGKRPPAPFTLTVPEFIKLTPGRDATATLALYPHNLRYSDFVAEEIHVSVIKKVVDKSVGTEGLEYDEAIWKRKRVLSRRLDPDKLEARGQLPDTKTPAWTYDLNLEGALQEDGRYALSLVIAGLYQRPMGNFAGKGIWTRSTLLCEDAVVRARSFEETRSLQAVLETQQQGLAERLGNLRQRERLVSVARFPLIAFLVVFGVLLLWRAFIPKSENEHSSGA